MSEYECNLCKKDGKNFRVPAGDHIGVAIMKEHLRSEHDVAMIGSGRI